MAMQRRPAIVGERRQARGLRLVVAEDGLVRRARRVRIRHRRVVVEQTAAVVEEGVARVREPRPVQGLRAREADAGIRGVLLVGGGGRGIEDAIGRGEAEFDGLVEFLRRGEVDAQLESRLGVLVMRGVGVDGGAGRVLAVEGGGESGGDEGDGAGALAGVCGGEGVGAGGGAGGGGEGGAAEGNFGDGHVAAEGGADGAGVRGDDDVGEVGVVVVEVEAEVGILIHPAEAFGHGEGHAGGPL